MNIFKWIFGQEEQADTNDPAYYFVTVPLFRVKPFTPTSEYWMVEYSLNNGTTWTELPEASVRYSWRLEMSNKIFRHKQDAIECAERLKQGYRLTQWIAEQDRILSDAKAKERVRQDALLARKETII